MMSPEFVARLEKEAHALRLRYEELQRQAEFAYGEWQAAEAELRYQRRPRND